MYYRKLAEEDARIKTFRNYINYIYIVYIMYIIYVIQGKNSQHFNKNISAIAFINSCQHLQFIYNA